MGQPAAKSLNAVRTHAPPVRPAAVTLAVETEALLRSTLDSLSAHIAVLDASGMIVAVNNAWRAFARQSGYVGDDCGVGSNYLSVCEAAASESSEARATAQALREIMAGRQRDFRIEYPCTGSRGPRWVQLRITPTRPIGHSAHRDCA